MAENENIAAKQARLERLIRIWEDNGNTREELLIDDLDLDVQIETVEHMLEMACLDFD